MFHFENVLLFLVICTFILLNQINATVSPSWVINDEIVNISGNLDHNNVQTGENHIIKCHIARTCLSAKLTQCTDPATVKWFLPINLPPKDNSQRKHISFDYEIVSQIINSTSVAETTSLNITSTLNLNQVGFIHAGHYEVLSLYEKVFFKLGVKENDKGKCNFHDQCLSHNCYDGSCRCNQTNQNYVLQTKSCVSRKLLGEECDSDAQCQLGNNIEPELMQQILPAKCLKYNSTFNICQCANNAVQVKLPTVTGQACLPKASYGEMCYFNVQCQYEGSFCGTDIRNATNKSSYLFCQCKNGWRHSPNDGNKPSSSCTPYARCDSSKLGFNEYFLQSNCSANQFCRNNYCLCVPNYEFNASGQCVPQSGLDFRNRKDPH